MLAGKAKELLYVPFLEILGWFKTKSLVPRWELRVPCRQRMRKEQTLFLSSKVFSGEDCSLCILSGWSWLLESNLFKPGFRIQLQPWYCKPSMPSALKSLFGSLSGVVKHSHSCPWELLILGSEYPRLPKEPMHLASISFTHLIIAVLWWGSSGAECFHDLSLVQFLLHPSGRTGLISVGDCIDSTTFHKARANTAYTFILWEDQLISVEPNIS